MANNRVTYKWAADRLGKSVRTIHNYIKDGLLQPVRDGKASFLSEEEVEDLAVELGTDAPLLTRKNLLAIQLRLKKLEEEMLTVKTILEIKDHVLRPSPMEAKGFLSAAAESLGRRKWGFEELSMWADQFQRMDEVTLDVFAAHEGSGKPWMVFYRLCIEMMKAVSDAQGIEAAALHKKLDEGRKKLRGTILLWIELGRGSVEEAVFAEVDDPLEAVMRRLSI